MSFSTVRADDRLSKEQSQRARTQRYARLLSGKVNKSQQNLYNARFD